MTYHEEPSAEPGVSRGPACRNAGHRAHWVVTVRNANYSAFNGGRRTPSPFSEIRCLACRSRWRSKGKFVARLPDAR
ncbi:hypothetical protein [Embleya sp. MST-111070]|uniref:hypothetical protein n=1 Tax=Embleya sp. MST-111070 TaxID=3398231 RepID=UPI003F73C482